jgi:hypothetical protein
MNWAAPGYLRPISPDWQQGGAGKNGMRIVVVGGAGCLGSALVARLGSDKRLTTVVIDKNIPPTPTGAKAVLVKLDGHDTHELAAHLRRDDVVIHLAALHGFHLDTGITDEECWQANYHLTESVTQACIMRRVYRLVFTSSTSVYGSGSDTGPARILDEATRVAPEDVYDRAKIAAEALVTAGGAQLRGGAVCLRLGRFRFDDEETQELRKLSTGLDVIDAATAVTMTVAAQRIVRPVYVLASDVCMPRSCRRALGDNLQSTVQRFMPSLSRLDQLGYVQLPERIGKSVSSERFCQDFNWKPSRTVETWARRRLARIPPGIRGCPEWRTA